MQVPVLHSVGKLLNERKIKRNKMFQGFSTGALWTRWGLLDGSFRC